ncbi:MAG: ABC-2 transporter permease [Tissierellia bacterium]|nr:ABC-2 transporter permease [Tissierellia bacterium]
MLAILKKDLILLFTNKRDILFMIFYIPFLIFIIDSYEPKWLYLAIIVSYTYITSLSSFYHDIDGKSKYILNSLPMTRDRIVLYKYISIFVYFFVTLVYVGAYLWIINATGLKIVDYFNLEMALKAIPIIMIFTSIVFPSYLLFEPRIAQIIHMVIFLSFFIGMVNLGSLGDKSFIKMIGIFQGNRMLILAIILYLASLIISIKLYRKKDL